MLDAAIAGIDPQTFDELTLGQIFIAIEGYHERERNNLIGRINAILRALQRKGDPFKGLTKQAQTSIGIAQARWMSFWASKG